MTKLQAPFGPWDKLKAWSVHLLTASGMVVGFLALQSAYSGKAYEAILLLLLTVAIDGIDGTFARMFRVQEVLPDFDGKMMDFVIDFVNFVVTPLVLFYEEKMVPAPALFPCIALMLLASLYHYSNKKQVTDDFYFLGFPAFWNLVVYYLFVLEMPAWGNLIVVLLFVVAHVLPIRFVYLSRMRHNIKSAVLLVLWMVVANATLLFVYPHGTGWLKAAAVVPMFGLLFLGWIHREVSLFRTSKNNQS